MIKKQAQKISVDEFRCVSLHGRRMAVSAITGSMTFGLGIPYINHFLWPCGTHHGDELAFPNALVEKVLQLPWDQRWAIAAELCRGLAKDEEMISEGDRPIAI